MINELSSFLLLMIADGCHKIEVKGGSSLPYYFSKPINICKMQSSVCVRLVLDAGSQFYYKRSIGDKIVQQFVLLKSNQVTLSHK